VISGSQDQTILLWDSSTGESQHLLGGHVGEVNSVAASPDGQVLMSGSADYTALLWDASTGTLLRTLKGHRDDVNSVVFSSDGTTAITGSEDGTVRLWDTSTGDLLRTLEGFKRAVSSVAFSLIGEAFAVAAGDLAIYHLRDRRGLELRALRAKNGSFYAYSRDANVIEFLGPDADVARTYPVCRIGTLTYAFALCAGRFELPGFAQAFQQGTSLDELL
jgi:WD40 repeat protein